MCPRNRFDFKKWSPLQERFRNAVLAEYPQTVKEIQKTSYRQAKHWFASKIRKDKLYCVDSWQTRKMCSCVHIYDNYWQKNLCLSWDLNLSSPVYGVALYHWASWDTYTNSETNLSPIHISIQVSQNVTQVLTAPYESNTTSAKFYWFKFHSNTIFEVWTSLGKPCTQNHR